MKQQLTNGEIYSVICLYSQSEMLVTRYNARNFKVWEMLPEIIEQVFESEERYLDKYQLLLTPLSKISDEDIIQVARICGMAFRTDGNELTTSNLNDEYREKITNILHNMFATDEDASREYGCITIAVFQFLVANGYAVHLWFGIDHWANGKTAIELNIAIDKTHP